MLRRLSKRLRPTDRARKQEIERKSKNWKFKGNELIEGCLDNCEINYTQVSNLKCAFTQGGSPICDFIDAR